MPVIEQKIKRKLFITRNESDNLSTNYLKEKSLVQIEKVNEDIQILQK